MRFGSVFKTQKSYGVVRRSSSLNVFIYGTVPLPVGKNGKHRFLSAVHGMNEPRFRSYGSHVFSRGTNEKPQFLYGHLMNKRHKPAGSYGILTRCVFSNFLRKVNGNRSYTKYNTNPIISELHEVHDASYDNMIISKVLRLTPPAKCSGAQDLGGSGSRWALK